MEHENNKERKRSSDNKTNIENPKLNKRPTHLIKNNSGTDLNFQKYQKVVSPKNIEYSECKNYFFYFSNKKI